MVNLNNMECEYKDYQKIIFLDYFTNNTANGVMNEPARTDSRGLAGPGTQSSNRKIVDDLLDLLDVVFQGVEAFA